MKSTNLILTSFSIVLPQYGEKIINDEFLKQIRKKFKKVGKQSAELIANEILDKYSINIQIKTIPDSKDPICQVLFTPKKRRLDK